MSRAPRQFFARWAASLALAALLTGTLLTGTLLTGGCNGTTGAVAASGTPGAFYLARHGQTAWNRISRFQGDPDLDQVGYLNRVNLWMLLKDTKLAAIYTSSKQRTKRTAALVAKQQKLRIQARAELDEIASGVLEGICYAHMAPGTKKVGAGECEVPVRGSRPALARAEVAKIWARVRAAGPKGRVPLGESYPDMIKRLRPLIPDLRAGVKQGNVLAVGHGVINRLVLHMLLGWSIDRVHRLRQENDQVYRIEGLAGSSVGAKGGVKVFLYTPGLGWKRCTPPAKAHQRALDCNPGPHRSKGAGSGIVGKAGSSEAQPASRPVKKP